MKLGEPQRNSYVLVKRKEIPAPAGKRTAVVENFASALLKHTIYNAGLSKSNCVRQLL
jgi:hypothetical protein